MSWPITYHVMICLVMSDHVMSGQVTMNEKEK